MSDDAQTPPKVPLSKPDQPADGAAATPKPWAPPVTDGPAGPGATIADTASPTPPAPSVHDQQTVTSLPGVEGPPPADAPPAAQPWASPFAPPPPSAPANGSAGNPFAPPAPSAPGYGSGSSGTNPFAPPAPSGPFGPPVGPPYAQGEPVPPPPIAPDGPGQVPYGYPGGYSHPSQPAYGGHGGGAHSPQAQSVAAYYGWPGMTPPPSNGLGTAGLVIGIISAAVFCLWPIAILMGILAVVFGVIGRGKAQRGEATNPGQALAGIICGAAGIVLGLVMIAFVIAT